MRNIVHEIRKEFGPDFKFIASELRDITPPTENAIQRTFALASALVCSSAAGAYVFRAPHGIGFFVIESAVTYFGFLYGSLYALNELSPRVGNRKKNLRVTIGAAAGIVAGATSVISVPTYVGYGIGSSFYETGANFVRAIKAKIAAPSP